ncbi:MAG: hypothetical protein L5656_11205 [Thermanaeromonas sp.]|uniref:hypothetical protein n=1 Tax=Thermanaeromonas sp. TaxID=2003697 RepID=UPI00243A2C28|nr:hypothetical protein [Thermanaeromonas sp.]MCG0279069.1 hypothetical protein [Thermanaeromonas sp.]
MAEYYNLKEDGKLVAWQFVGPKERIETVARGTALTLAGEKEDEDEEKVLPTIEGARPDTPKRGRGQGGGAGAPEQLRLF